MGETKKRWSDCTWVYTSSVREGEHEAEFARSAVRRVLQLKHGGGAQVRVCGGEGVWRVVKEGLEHAGLEVSRSPMGTTSRVDVSVGEDAVGASVLCVNRVGLVWLVDAHWTMAQYAEWAEALLASGGLSDAWTGMLNACMGLFEVIAGIRVPDAQFALEELKKYCGEAREELESLEGVLRSVKGVGSDEERRGVLLRGVTKGKAAVEGTVRAVEKAIAAIDAVDY